MTTAQHAHTMRFMRTKNSTQTATFGMKLREYRLRNRLSFSQMAREAGVAESTLRKIAMGQINNPQELTLYSLRQKFPDLFAA